MSSVIGLSERMRLIAEKVPEGSSVADIGTDHGFIPIWLYQTGRASRVILTDIADGPLSKAAENLEKYGIESSERISLRKGAGLAPLKKGETDVVIIAGMGGELIAQILTEDPEKAKSSDLLILQPRTMCDKLRRMLDGSGFKVIDEQLVVEGPQIAQIITAVPEEKLAGREYQVYESDFDYDFPPLLFRRRDKNLKAFLKRGLNHTKLVIFNLKSAKPDLAAGKLKIWEEKKKSLEEKLTKI